MLLHDDKNSNYFIGSKPSGIYKHWRYTKDEILKNIPESEAYITLNGFYGWRKNAILCRQINALFFDLDYHEKVPKSEIDWRNGHNFQLLQDAIHNQELYNPNIIVNSGRGLQLYYIFENSIPYHLKDGSTNDKALYSLRKIRETITNQLNNILASTEYPLEVDNKVGDLSRIVRIPGTYNKKAKSVATILYVNQEYCKLADFYTKVEKPQIQKPYIKKPTKSHSQDALQHARLIELKKLQEYRNFNCIGCREIMCFLFFNAASQVYSKEDATNELKEFNSKFSEPIPECQIRAILKEKHYKISKDYIIKNLNITEVEMQQLKLFSTNNLSRVLKKAQTKKNKQERNKEILNLVSAGVRHADIAVAVGVSLRTVQNVLKENNITRNYTKSSA